MEDSLFLTCLGCLGLFVVWAALNLAIAWVLEWAWNFVVPLFHGPRIDYTVACAICVLLSLVRMSLTISSKS